VKILILFRYKRKKNKAVKKIYIIISVVLALLVAVYLYVNHKPHRDVASEEAVKIKSSELFKAYETNEKKADELYLNKVLEVSGEIGEILEDTKGAGLLILKGENDFFGVKCALKPDQKNKLQKLEEGNVVKIKGLCTGGGGGMDVELVKCTIAD
jgi:hypothetical protein